MSFPLIVNTSNLEDDDALFVCASAHLEDTFKDITKDRNYDFTYLFVGTRRGSMRTYPINKQHTPNDECEDYDPRFRPWYVAAASGSKKITIIIDISGSMNQN